MIDGYAFAKIFGPIFIIIGLWEILCPKNVMAYYRSAKENNALLIFGGFINLLLAFTIINYYNEWMWGWGLLVTLLGWGGLLKGISLFFYPKWVAKFKIKKNQIWIGGLVITLWGIGLCYFGYF
ncbi:hypothetical protein ACFLRA_02225 [Bdellovibrionota bacterium]